VKISKAQKRDSLKKSKKFKKSKINDFLYSKEVQRRKAVSIKQKRKIKERLMETEDASI